MADKKPDSTNKYKATADLYAKVFPGANIYKKSAETVRKYKEGFGT